MTFCKVEITALRKRSARTIGKQWLPFLALATLILILAVHPTFSTSNTSKLIEWGWRTPLPTYIRDHIREMEQLPFDGLVLDLQANTGPSHTGGRFSWHVWDNKVLRAEDYSKSIDALKQTQFKRFTENFLRFNVVPGRIDWYDKNFSSVLANARLAARIAKQIPLRGILFDTEQYRGKLFHYRSQQRRNEHSFHEYQQRVRQHGREFMEALNAEYPDIIVMLTLSYNKAYLYKQPLDKAQYGLLPSFIDGMLDAAMPNTLIIDGWEASFAYKRKDQYQAAYNLIHKDGLTRTGAPEKFRQHYRASFGLWLDYRGKWDQTDFGNNYFTPEKFERSLCFALQRTDHYVWVYSQKVQWWDRQVPQSYIDALINARQVHPTPSSSTRC